jgi:hypothetical protein
MRHIKLNTNWLALADAAKPILVKNDDGIEISFSLNPMYFEHIDDGEKGKLSFHQVYAYYFGSTNQERYRKAKFLISNNELPIGELYELKDSKWDADFPENKIMLKDKINKKEIRHFIFFLKNAVLECLASDVAFTFENGIVDTLAGKYPKAYLNHYITMFCNVFDKPNTDNFKVYIDLYIQMESKKELANLKAELIKIKQNNDLQLYLKFANRFGLPNFSMQQLNEMIKVIEQYKI